MVPAGTEYRFQGLSSCAFGKLQVAHTCMFMYPPCGQQLPPVEPCSYIQPTLPLHHFLPGAAILVKASWPDRGEKTGTVWSGCSAGCREGKEIAIWRIIFCLGLKIRNCWEVGKTGNKGYHWAEHVPLSLAHQEEWQQQQEAWPLPVQSGIFYTNSAKPSVWFVVDFPSELTGHYINVSIHRHSSPLEEGGILFFLQLWSKEKAALPFSLDKDSAWSWYFQKRLWETQIRHKEHSRESFWEQNTN